jgi:hypothetical protein
MGRAQPYRTHESIIHRWRSAPPIARAARQLIAASDRPRADMRSRLRNGAAAAVQSAVPFLCAESRRLCPVFSTEPGTIAVIPLAARKDKRRADCRCHTSAVDRPYNFSGARAAARYPRPGDSQIVDESRVHVYVLVALGDFSQRCSGLSPTDGRLHGIVDDGPQDR